MFVTLALTTTPGLEKALIEEVEPKIKVLGTGPGRVYVESIDQYIPWLHNIPLIHRVFRILSEGEISRDKPLEQVKSLVKQVPWEEILEPSKPFAIRGERLPKEYPHPFRSIDLGKPAGEAVIERIKETTGKRIPVNLKKPTYEIFVEVIREHVRVMLNLTGESLHKRGYRIRGHDASLSTTIARFMVKQVELSNVCDPMCGSGTILIEARLEYQEVPISRIRSKTYGFIRPHVKPFKDLPIEDRKNKRKDQMLTFGDRSSKSLDAALLNSIRASKLSEAPEKYRIDNLAKYNLWDIREVDKLDCDAIITNPPYGIRLGNPRSVADTYEALFRLAKGKSLVLITPRHDLIPNEPDVYYDVMHGNLPVRIYVWKTFE